MPNRSLHISLNNNILAQVRVPVEDIHLHGARVEEYIVKALDIVMSMSVLALIPGTMSVLALIPEATAMFLAMVLQTLFVLQNSIRTATFFAFTTA